MISSSPTSSPFQRVGSSRSKPSANEFVGQFCAAHPPSIRRTRNDDEYYGGFRRSASLRRSQRGGMPESSGYNRPDQQQPVLGHRSAIPGRAERAWPKHHQPTQPHLGFSQGENSNYVRGGKPGYQQDTLTSIRRSRERAQASPQQQRGSLSRTPSLRGSQQRGSKPGGLNNNSSSSSSRPGQPHVSYENEVKSGGRPISMYTVNPQQQQQAQQQAQQQQQQQQQWRESNYHNRSGHQPAQQVSSSNDFYRIYRPSNGNIVCSTIGRTTSGIGGSNVDTFFQRTGSFHSGSGYQTISGGSGGKDSNQFLRSFSFRKRDVDDNNLTSSMPCLNDDNLQTPSSASTAMTTPRSAQHLMQRGNGLDRTPSFRSTNFYNSPSGTMTPASSSLVIYSLAYQILPTPRIPAPPPPAPASAPVSSGYPFIYGNGQIRKQGSAGSGGQIGMMTSISASRFD